MWFSCYLFFGYRTRWFALISSAWVAWFNPETWLFVFPLCASILPIAWHFSIDSVFKNWKPVQLVSIVSLVFAFCILLFQYSLLSSHPFLYAPLLLLVFSNFWRLCLVLILYFIMIHLWQYRMDLSIAHLVSISTLFVFIPKEFWQKLLYFISRKHSPLTVYYEAHCMFCKKSVALLKVFLILPYVSFKPATSDKVLQKMQLENSWLAWSETEKHSFQCGFTVFIMLVKRSPLLFYIAPILQIKWVSKIGEKLYQSVANHRNVLAPLLSFVVDEKASIGRVYSLFFIFCFVSCLVFALWVF